MKNIGDKIKDFLYDATEYILMVAIIAIVVLVINWRLEGLFAMDIENSNVQTETSDESIVDEFSDYAEDQEDPESEENKEDDKDEAEGQIVYIEIPSGTLPGEIGNILVANNLIDSQNEFINKVIQMGVEKKLKSGSFKIAKGSSLEEIINILTK